MPLTWSHSALKNFETCPRQYHEVKVLEKYPYTDTPQTRYGKELHLAAELYVRDGIPIPEQFAFIQDTVDALLKKPGDKYAELEMAMTVDLRPCDFNDESRWVRGIADLVIVDEDEGLAWVIDWKTGSDKYPDKGQLDLMALMVFAKFPGVQRVNSALLFVVRNTIVKHKTLRTEAHRLWEDYRQRVAFIEAALSNGVWNPKPSGLCKNYCPVNTCEHNGHH